VVAAEVVAAVRAVAVRVALRAPAHLRRTVRP